MITACALFNFYSKWVDATGVGEMSAAEYAASGERLATEGVRTGGSVGSVGTSSRRTEVRIPLPRLTSS